MNVLWFLVIYVLFNPACIYFQFINFFIFICSFFGKAFEQAAESTNTVAKFNSFDSHSESTVVIASITVPHPVYLFCNGVAESRYPFFFHCDILLTLHVMLGYSGWSVDLTSIFF